jgi:predicted phosphodiesterase
MRCAIIADIHANLAAFTMVLDDIESRGEVEALWCLGDVVGYGPDPHRSLELLRRQEHICVAGNHDWAAIGRIDTNYFNPAAAEACHWTSQQLTDEDKQYLESLPLLLEQGDFTLAHGSPREPIREYIQSDVTARENLAYFKTPFCLVGHSHVPFVFECDESGQAHFGALAGDTVLRLAEKRLIINPGSVGQPRDGDPRAGYAIYDSEACSVTHYRIPYDIAATQSRMREYGLPESLVRRLGFGR